MRTVVIFVEGSKDAYFIRELIVRCMPGFKEEENPLPRSVPSKHLMRLRSDSANVSVYWTEGFGNLKGLRSELRKPKELEPEDEFVSCVIFDSDEPNGKNADVSPGQEARPDALCQLMGIKDADDREIAKKYIFLFPDGKKDGDLEVILRNAVSDTPEHLKYFSGPWSHFESEVSEIPANRPTRKSMMNEYKAAFDDRAWEKNGLNLAMSNAKLWDWNSESLLPVKDFLFRMIAGPVERNLSDLVPEEKK